MYVKIAQAEEVWGNIEFEKGFFLENFSQMWVWYLQKDSWIHSFNVPRAVLEIYMEKLLDEEVVEEKKGLMDSYWPPTFHIYPLKERVYVCTHMESSSVRKLMKLRVDSLIWE